MKLKTFAKPRDAADTTEGHAIVSWFDLPEGSGISLYLKAHDEHSDHMAARLDLTREEARDLAERLLKLAGGV